MRKKVIGIIFLILSLAWFIYLCYQSLLPGVESTVESSRVTDLIVSIFPKLPDFASKFVTIDESTPLSSYIRKTIGHFGSYGLLGILTFIGIYLLIDKKLNNQIIHLVVGYLLCAATEIIQLFINGRGGSLGDTLLNYEGFVCATLYVVAILIIISLINKKPCNINNKVNFIIYLGLSIVVAILHIFISSNAKLDFFANLIFYSSICIYLLLALIAIIINKKKA